MLTRFSIKPLYEVSVRDLLRFQKEGCPTIRNSHAGNASLYKLLLSQLGLWDCVWDVTCVHKDVNNQPRDKFLQGQRIPLLHYTLSEEKGIKHLTPFQRCEDGTTLSSVHMQPLRTLYGSEIITTNSEMLLKYRENIKAVFDAIGQCKPSLFGRYVLPCGCMVELTQRDDNRYCAKCTHIEVVIHRNELAESAFGMLEELCRLVWEPKGYVPKGGALYSLELVVACFFLMCYWQFGQKTIYMLSGPDMIKYATQKDFVDTVRKVMALLGEVIPHLVPQSVEACIVPTTLFRFGYPVGCTTSEAIMDSHKAIWKLQKERRTRMKEGLSLSDVESNLIPHLRYIEEHGKKWDLFHNPAKDVFFSQHDLLASGNTRLEIIEEYLDIPFTQLQVLLSNLGQMERSLSRTFCSRN